MAWLSVMKVAAGFRSRLSRFREEFSSASDRVENEMSDRFRSAPRALTRPSKSQSESWSRIPMNLCVCFDRGLVDPGFRQSPVRVVDERDGNPLTMGPLPESGNQGEQNVSKFSQKLNEGKGR